MTPLHQCVFCASLSTKFDVSLSAWLNPMNRGEGRELLAFYLRVVTTERWMIQ